MSAFDKIFMNRVVKIRKGLQAYKKPPHDTAKEEEVIFRKKGAGKDGRR